MRYKKTAVSKDSSFTESVNPRTPRPHPLALHTNVNRCILHGRWHLLAHGSPSAKPGTQCTRVGKSPTLMVLIATTKKIMPDSVQS